MKRVALALVLGVIAFVAADTLRAFVQCAVAAEVIRGLDSGVSRFPSAMALVLVPEPTLPAMSEPPARRLARGTAAGIAGLYAGAASLRQRCTGARPGRHGAVAPDNTGGKRTIAMDGLQFIERLLMHVLPSGFKRIRHYGLLAPAAKTERLALARQLLAMPPANPRAREDAQAFMRRVAAIEISCCPHCKSSHWQVIEQVLADRMALAAIVPTACRGPP